MFFFLEDPHVVEIFNFFPLFSGLKPNLINCQIAGTGALKGLQLAICGMKCMNLRNDTIKILGTYFSYSKTINEESKFCKIVSNVRTVLKQ